MPVVVFTKNTTPQFTPYGAIDTQHAEIDDTHLSEVGGGAAGYSAPRSLGPSAADRNVFLIRPEFIHQIPSNATNIQARLYINTGGGFGSFDVDARSVEKYWLETAASWDNYTIQLPWDAGGGYDAADRGVVEDSETVSAGQWYQFDVPTIVASLIADPLNNTGIGLWTDTVTSAYRAVNASNFASDGVRPELHISYDEPTSGGASGLIRNFIHPLAENTGILKALTGSGGGGPNAIPSPITRKIHVFGHSLFDHGTFQANEFTKAGWVMGDISRQSFNYLAISQIFGQLRDQVLPPPIGSKFNFATTQFDNWPSGTFIDADYDDALIMASNFEQVSKTPATFATESDPVLSWVDTNTTARQIIYEHWSEAAQYGLTIINDNDLSPADWATFIALHRDGGAYHTWHIDYQDQIQTNGYTIYMIPVGPIIFDAIATESYLSSITHADLFVDDAPHGNATMYFLAGLVTYIALFGVPSSSYVPRQSSFLNSAVANNVSSLISFISSRLTFYGANGVNLPPSI